jgi:hypothetical protein
METISFQHFHKRQAMSDKYSSSPHARVVVVGACNVDLISYVDQPLPLAPGATVKGSSFAQGWGGKGANQVGLIN